MDELWGNDSDSLALLRHEYLMQECATMGLLACSRNSSTHSRLRIWNIFGCKRGILTTKIILEKSSIEEIDPVDRDFPGSSMNESKSEI